MIAYVGLGSNLGDRLRYLMGALVGLQQLGSVVEPSPVYETAPVGGPAGQAAYLNLVARVSIDRTPRQLLEAAQQLEERAGRVRTVRFGPRTLDVDLLLIDDLSIAEPDLVVPHPRLGERAFVLAPLEDLDPAATPPGWRERLGGQAAVDAAVRKALLLEPIAEGTGWLARPVGDGRHDGA